MDYKFKVGVSLGIGDNPVEDEKLMALVKSNLERVEIVYSEHCNEPSWADTVRDAIDSSPVIINSVHAPFSAQVDISRVDEGGQEYAVEQISKAILLAENLGARMVVVHASSEPITDAERLRRLDQSKSGLEILAGLAERSELKLALELLPRSCLGNTVEELKYLIQDISPQSAGICLDANHPAHAEKLPEITRQLNEKIITLHISDYDGIDEKHWMPFEGIVNWADFANALKDIDYQGAFIYETMPKCDTMAENLETISSNFQRILKEASEKA